MIITVERERYKDKMQLSEYKQYFISLGGDGWMASLTQWMWIWVNSGSWWWAGRPAIHGVAKSQTQLSNWTEKFALEYQFSSGLLVHHHLPEFTQTHIHRVGDAIQPSHPWSSPSPPAPNPSQHQSLFHWVNSSHEVAKVLEFQL